MPMSDDDKEQAKRVRCLSLGFLALMVGGGAIQIALTYFDKWVDELSSVSLSDTETLKDLLFSGEPNLFVCADEYEQYKKPLQKAGSLIYKELGLTAYTIDCKGYLPKGQTVLERLKLRQGTTAFITGDATRAVSLATLMNEERVVKALKTVTVPKLHNVVLSSPQFTACVTRPRCVVLGYGNEESKKNIVGSSKVKNALENYRRVRVVSMDSSRFELKGVNSEQHSIAKSTDYAICLLRKKNEKSGEKPTHSYYYAFNTFTNPAEVESVIAQCNAFDPTEVEATNIKSFDPELFALTHTTAVPMVQLIKTTEPPKQPKEEDPEKARKRKEAEERAKNYQRDQQKKREEFEREKAEQQARAQKEQERENARKEKEQAEAPIDEWENLKNEL